MILREFYEFAKRVSPKNDMLTSICIFFVDQNRLNSLVQEYNKIFNKEHFLYDYGWMICLDDESIFDFLKAKGFNGSSCEVQHLVNNEFFANQEVVNFEIDDSGDGCYTVLRMDDSLFEEYRRYFVYIEKHDVW